eukprot:3669165-Prymnesium_polylepis.1
MAGLRRRREASRAAARRASCGARRCRGTVTATAVTGVRAAAESEATATATAMTTVATGGRGTAA